MQIDDTDKPSARFNLLGMLLTLGGGIGAAAVAGAILYGISLVIPLGIPMLYPVLLGVTAGIVTERLGSTVGRCRSQKLAIGVAVIVGVFAASSLHLIDYARFRLDAYNAIVEQVPQADSAAINDFIDQWLVEEAGQQGFVGFMLLKATEDSLEITHFYHGAGIGSFRLTGVLLALYWLVELLVAAGLSGLMNRSYSLRPYCEHCNTWRKERVPIVGSVQHIKEAVEAFQRKDIEAAVQALGIHDEGDFARLETEFCPVCYDNPHTRLAVVRDTGETTVWSGTLDANSMQQLMELAE